MSKKNQRGPFVCFVNDVEMKKIQKEDSSALVSTLHILEDKGDLPFRVEIVI